MPVSKFSVIIVPDNTGNVVRKHIAAWKVVTVFSTLAVFFIVSIFFTVGYFKANIDRHKMANLKAENMHLASKIKLLNESVESFKSQMSDVIKTDENIRLLFDLPLIDRSIREVGIGGPAVESDNFNSPVVQELSLVEDEIEKILRQIKLENASFSDIYGKIQKKKKVLDHTPSIMPVDGYITCGVGMRINPFTGFSQMHNGIDIAAEKGTPVYATADGQIIYSGWDKGLGYTVIIDHGHGLKTYYGHLSVIKKHKGTRVKRMDVIGLVGSTGYSTGPHVHYEIHKNNRPVNPNEYVFKSIIYES